MKFRPLVTQWLIAQLAVSQIARAQSSEIFNRPGGDPTEQPEHYFAAVARFTLNLCKLSYYER